MNLRPVAAAGRRARALIAVIAGIEACDAPDADDITEVDAPDFDQFAGTNATPGTQAGVSACSRSAAGRSTATGRWAAPLRIYGRVRAALRRGRRGQPAGPAGDDPDRARGELPVRHRASAGAHDARSTTRAAPAGGAAAPSQAAAARAPQGRRGLRSGDDAYTVHHVVARVGQRRGRDGLRVRACSRVAL